MTEYMEIDEIKRMAKEGRREEALEALRGMLEAGEGDRETLLLEMGVIYNGMADRQQALNCLNEVLRMNPGNTRARVHVEMINSILNYYCKDLLNP